MIFVEKTDFKVDLDILRTDCESILKKVPFLDNRLQLGLNHRPGIQGEQQFLDNVGTLWDKENQKHFKDPAGFSCLNDLIANTYLESVIKNLVEWAEHPLGRVRLMARPPRTCYSIHKDEGWRLHLALWTDPQALFLFPEQEKIIHIPADSFFYDVNTTLAHTAINASQLNRVHLVVDYL